jgi:hypothetical protein
MGNSTLLAELEISHVAAESAEAAKTMKVSLSVLSAASAVGCGFLGTTIPGLYEDNSTSGKRDC